jgi:peptidoglycan L-alanyl-D-glutamate endopeptidase CwlK
VPGIHRKEGLSMNKAGLSGSVGAGGDNYQIDVWLVQRMLNDALPRRPAHRLSGICGPETVDRIKRFQRRFMRRPDGRVDVNGPTYLRLLRLHPGKNWRGHAARWDHSKKIESLHRVMRPRVEDVLEQLWLKDFQPKIHYGWRSLRQQADIVARGRSRVTFSFHNVQMNDGTPSSYAADIIDRRWGWEQQAMDSGFWTALGDAAKTADLYWGGNWGRPDYAHVQYWNDGKLKEFKEEAGL